MIAKRQGDDEIRVQILEYKDEWQEVLFRIHKITKDDIIKKEENKSETLMKNFLEQFNDLDR